jgi:hypothetical protein
MTVTDIFHDIHLPEDKTSIVTARGSTVVCGLAVSKNKISSLPTDPFSFFFAMLSETNNFVWGLREKYLQRQQYGWKYRFEIYVAFIFHLSLNEETLVFACYSCYWIS